MQPAGPRELGAFEAGDHAEYPHLLGVLELGLEAHHVEQRAEPVVLAQLHDGMRLCAWPVRVGEPDGLHRTEPQGFAAAFGHYLDRQAAVEIWRRGFPFVERDPVAGEKRVKEGLV